MAKRQMDPDQFLRERRHGSSIGRNPMAEEHGAGSKQAWRLALKRGEPLNWDLRNALETEAFELHYQPLFNLKTRSIQTCEALLRWPHPTRGMVPAAEFIPVAEEMGLIVEISKQALNKACLECLRWPGATSVAVNLSSMQFSRSNVPALVQDVLASTNFSANRLEIEITESTLLHTRKNPPWISISWSNWE